MRKILKKQNDFNFVAYQEPEEDIAEETEPACLRKWNWGAFVLPALWGLFNNVYWPLFVNLGLYAIGSQIVFAENIIGRVIFLTIGSLAMGIYLGIKGNSLSWEGLSEKRHITRFEKRQLVWNIIGVLSFVLTIIYILATTMPA